MANEVPNWASALGRVPSGLFIVTAGVADDATGFLASWVQQVGFDPPSVSIAVKSGRAVANSIRRYSAFCVSILDAQSKSLMGHFARGFEPGESAFEGVAVSLARSGVPYLTDAAAYLECELLGEACWSDHVIFGGHVIDGGVAAGDPRDREPLIHLRTTGQSY